MGKSRGYGWDVSKLCRFEVLHDCGHLMLGRREPAETKEGIVSISVDRLGAEMKHTMGSDDEAFELLNKMVEAWKRRHN